LFPDSCNEPVSVGPLFLPPGFFCLIPVFSNMEEFLFNRPSPHCIWRRVPPPVRLPPTYINFRTSAVGAGLAPDSPFSFDLFDPQKPRHSEAAICACSILTPSLSDSFFFCSLGVFHFFWYRYFPSDPPAVVSLRGVSVFFRGNKSPFSIPFFDIQQSLSTTWVVLGVHPGASLGFPI